MSSRFRPSRRASAGALLWLALLLAPGAASGDAIVRSQAMFASTIAEYRIQRDVVEVELEIGISDLEAFANLLPDALYERLGRAPRPEAERRGAFFQTDLAIRADDGPPLAGRVLEIGPRERLARDPVTGEPLPTGDAEPEAVVFARLAYTLSGRPATLTLQGPRGRASIGFVAYHEGIAVNDFRYLSPAQTLALDWSDPWYTRFGRHSLQRQYFAPMSGFLYVEPWEVRKEIIARPMDLQRWVDLGLDGRDTIPVELQPEVRRRAAAFLREHHPVVIDGVAIEPELLRANFLERTLRSSRVVDPPVPLDVKAAILGVIFVYPLPEPMPQKATLEWDLWDERIARVPASSVDAAGPLPTILEPDFRVLEWQNFLRFPVVPSLEQIEAPPRAWQRALFASRWAALGLAGLLVLHAGLRRGRASGLAALLPLAVAGAGFSAGAGAALSETRSKEIVSGLLHNVYRAFDYRAEEKIYDVLETSATGDLLAEVYLETRRGLELASQGGARAKVKEIELEALEVEPGDGGAFSGTATWVVRGSIGHWGHVHQRSNRYRAALDVAPVAGRWKLRDLEILQEERL